MKFWPTFSFYNIEVYDPLISNFRDWASDKRASQKSTLLAICSDTLAQLQSND